MVEPQADNKSVRVKQRSCRYAVYDMQYSET